MLHLSPEYPERFEWFLRVLEIRDTEGWRAAQDFFIADFVGLETEEEWRQKPRAVTSEANQIQYMCYELESLMAYSLNFETVKNNGTSYGVMRGVGSGDAFYAESMEDVARVMDCPKYDVPGHHGGFESETEAFVPYFLKMLDELESRRRAKSA
jgi:hypothetical protein